MNRRSSLSGRLSLSTTNLSSPIAESTHINGSSAHMKFPWGEKLISPTRSSDIIAQKKTPKIQMSPINKIDPRVYIDVQSKGLASRIVKYHENSSKLNRSLSTGNLYNKPGQFPVVHLKKKEIVYKPNKNQSISMVRIAPPDKSVFQANTRSSILRTGSIVPTVSLHRDNEQISGENRPILHPAGNDIAPTRSVLDALREISRKRINSDELDCSDNVKKYCKEPDEISGGYIRPMLTFNSSMAKRQREGPSSPNSVQSTSPEQLSKKRLCSRNNDVTSSLSSSLMMVTPKRKFDDVRSGRSNERTTKSDSPTPPKSKQQRYGTNCAPLQKIEAVIQNQITPLPPTPAVEPFKQNQPLAVPAEAKAQVGNEKPKPKLTLFNKNYDETPVMKVANNFRSKFEDHDLPGVTFVKPKSNSQVSSGTNPLIERTKKSKLALMLSGLSGELNDDELDGKLVKSTEVKDTSGKTRDTNVVNTITTTSSSSLSASISFETKTTASTTTIPTVSAATQSNKENQNTCTTTAMTTVSFSQVATSTPTVTAVTTASNQSITPSTSAVTLTNGSILQTPASEAPPAGKSSLASSLQKPVSTGFTFGSPIGTSGRSPTTTAAASATPSTTSNTVSFPSSGVSSNLLATASNATVTSAKAIPTFSFGKTSTTTSSTNPLIFSTTSSTSPANPTKINFGSPTSSASAVSTSLGTTMSSAPIASSANTPMLFSNVPKSAMDFRGSKAMQTSNTISTPSFGILSTSKAATPVSTTSSPNTTGVGHQLGSFSAPHKSTFDGSNTSSLNLVASANSTFTSTAKSLFGIPPADNSKSPGKLFESKPTGGFSFKPPSTTQNANTTLPSAPNPAFAFNSTSNQKPTATTASGFSFGASSPATGGFSFTPSSTIGGNNKPPAESSGFSFGTKNTTPSSGGFTLSGTPSDNKTQNAPTTPTNFAFGMPSQQVITVNSTPANSSTETKPNPFSFGGTPQTQKSTVATENKPNAFIFGNVGSQQPATTNAGAAFGAAPVTSAQSIFGAPTAANSSIFGTKSSVFGAPAATTSSIFGSPATTTGSAFSAPTTTLNTTFGTPTAASNTTFGTPSTTSTFGVSAANPSSAFNSITAEKKPAAFVFGSSFADNNTSAPTKTFSFGTSTSTTAAAGAASGSFAFNSSTVTENKNIFAAPGAAPNTFTFGPSSSNNTDSKDQFAVSSNNNNSVTGPSFGAPALNQSKGFNFTAAPANSTAPSLFGATAGNKSDAPFTFGASSQQQPVAANNNSQPFAFGASSTSTPFAFNAASPASTAPTSDANKTFTFGGPSSNTTNTANPFGGTSSPVFNFSAGANTNSANPTAPPNPFNMQPNSSSSSTTTAGDRIIRKVARRIPK